MINSLRTQVDPLSRQVSELTAQVQEYSSDIATKDSQIAEISSYTEALKGQMEELKEQSAGLTAELSNKSALVDKLNSDMEAYNLTFGDLTDVFKKYQGLTPGTKAGLTEVFNEDLNVRSFLSSGAQWGHIQALWEFTQQKINNEDFSDVRTLNEIFRYFLDFHNSSYPSPIYALLDTKPGDAFDEEQHTKVMSREERKNAFFAKKPAGNEGGSVKEVVLCGYKNLRNGRVLKQSMVKV